MKIRPLIIMLLAAIAVQCTFRIVAAKDRHPTVVASTESLSCAAPTALTIARCQAMEETILRATVHLTLYTRFMTDAQRGSRIFSSNGHATVVGGRYLVTHNHYDETVMRLLQEGDPDNMLTIDIYSSQGDLLLQTPGQAVTITPLGHETILLDFGLQAGLGALAALGLASASYLTPAAVNLQPGLAVAQVDWDGRTTRINWVSISAIGIESDTAIVKLSDCVGHGASGGGVFWQGQLIGNNWSTSGDCDLENGPGISHHSKAALNLAHQALP